MLIHPAAICSKKKVKQAAEFKPGAKRWHPLCDSDCVKWELMADMIWTLHVEPADEFYSRFEVRFNKEGKLREGGFTLWLEAQTHFHSH